MARGKLRVLYQVSSAKPGLFAEAVLQDKNKRHLVIGYFQRGDCFGEHSSLNDLPNPFSVEVASPKAEFYKILRSNFVQYFGGL